MAKFFIFDPYNEETLSFVSESEAIEHLEKEAREAGETVPDFIKEHDIVIVEGDELLYKPPRDGASLVLKGK